MTAEPIIQTKPSIGRLFVPSIAFMVFALNIGGLTSTLLTREIGVTFFGSDSQAAVGITSQLSAVGFAAAVAGGVAMSLLAIRFRYKSLLLVGVFIQIIAAGGRFIAPTFLWMQIFAALEGVGSVVSSIALITLLGDYLPQNRKAKVVSYITAAAFIAGVIGPPAISAVADLGSWRYVYLLLQLPFAIAAFGIAFFNIPFVKKKQRIEVDRKNYMRNFKAVLMNKSAASCLVASLFFSGVMGLFAINFLRQQFLSDLSLPLQVRYASYVVMVSTLLFAGGSLVAGRLAGRFGVKMLTVVGALGDGIFTALLFFAPNLWIALALNWAHVWSATTAGTALTCLALDQVPEARGTMMSMKNVFANIGNTIGPAIGGPMLIWASYQAIGFTLGGMSLIASVIILFLSKDPK